MVTQRPGTEKIIRELQLGAVISSDLTTHVRIEERGAALCGQTGPFLQTIMIPDMVLCDVCHAEWEYIHGIPQQEGENNV